MTPWVSRQPWSKATSAFSKVGDATTIKVLDARFRVCQRCDAVTDAGPSLSADFEFLGEDHVLRLQTTSLTCSGSTPVGV